MRMEPARWYHVCLARHSPKFKVIVDDEVVYSTILSSSPPIALNGTLVIGQDQDIPGGMFNPLQSFVGKFLDLNIWSTKESFLCYKKRSCTKIGESCDPLIKFEDIPFKLHGEIENVTGHPCSVTNNVAFIWPKPMEFQDASILCNQFNFSVPEIRSKI